LILMEDLRLMLGEIISTLKSLNKNDDELLKRIERLESITTELSRELAYLDGKFKLLFWFVGAVLFGLVFLLVKYFLMIA